MTREEIEKVLDLHKKWFSEEVGGSGKHGQLNKVLSVIVPMGKLP